MPRIPSRSCEWTASAIGSNNVPYRRNRRNTGYGAIEELGALQLKKESGPRPKSDIDYAYDERIPGWRVRHAAHRCKLCQVALDAIRT